ncbi:MAG TPA: SDR family NAD(P)-dependent oxidoreductase [Candidatus Angelobacter sp.]|nr:SDR family NAD(P)-dependent oxidoreductase [Candidatus Angelobacter sp.]
MSVCKGVQGGYRVEGATQLAAVVTGGAGGIGSALSQRLAQDGFYVYVCCNGNREGGAELVSQIRSQGGEAELLAFDVKDAVAVGQSLKPVSEGRRPIGALVHAAGVVSRTLFATTSSESWETVVAANLNGFFHCVRPLLRRMIRDGQGSVVAISSVIADRGLEGQGAYAASKAGLVGAVRSLAREVGSYNIRANIVSPGWIRAGMNTGDPPEAVRCRIPMRRAGTAAEVAEAVSFLCSPRASYISGAVIPVSGGLDM